MPPRLSSGLLLNAEGQLDRNGVAYDVGKAVSSSARAVRQIMSNIGVSALANILLSLISLPLLVLAVPLAALLGSPRLGPTVLVLLVGGLPFPLAAGLQNLCYMMAKGERFDLWAYYWSGLRQFGRAAVRPWLVGMLGTVVLASNVVFYGRMGASPMRFVAVLWAYGLLFWLAIHIYVYPLLLRQDEPGVRRLYRNAFLIVIRRPLFSLTVLLLWLLTLALGAFTFLAAFGGIALAAAIQQNATAQVLTLLDNEPAPERSSFA